MHLLLRPRLILPGDIKNELDEEHPQRKPIEKISNAAETMSRRAGNLMQFVTNFRKLTRLPSPEREVVKVQSLFDHVSQIFYSNGSKNKVKLITEINPPELELDVDPEQMEQALINLLRNAAQELSNREDGEIKLTAGFNRRGRIYIEVSDNGAGIEEDILSKIFVPYFTTKPEGSGIGLALTRQIMTVHGGFISASNCEDGGACFKMVF